MNSPATIREGTIIYPDVTYGEGFVTGHNCVIRGPTTFGNNCLVGTGTIIEGECYFGNDVRIQSGVFVPRKISVGDNVFIGPCVVITNDKYPPSEMRYMSIANNVTIGANATILPGVLLEHDCFIAAAAVVTKDVPPYHMAIGNPAKIVDLPEGIKNRRQV